MDKRKQNKLYLEGEAVSVFEEKTRSCGYFCEVITIDSVVKPCKLKNIYFIIANLFLYLLRGFGSVKMTMVTPSHNVPCRKIREYSRNTELIILDEGIQSTQLNTASGKKNSLYRNDFFGKLRISLSSYFISVYRSPQIKLIQCEPAMICGDVKEIIANSDASTIDFDLQKKISSSGDILEKVFGDYNSFHEDGIKNKALIFTQPIYLYSEEKFQIFKRNLIGEIKKLNINESLIFIKLHPRDDKSRYEFLFDENLIKDPICIPPRVPFELIASRMKFDVGIGPNSTLIRSKCVKQKIILNEY